jgi:peptidoglycan/xylan/chitin deacetylase (PgdA/CDA1 family)/uncharacterized caspase-like protein
MSGLFRCKGFLVLVGLLLLTASCDQKPKSAPDQTPVEPQPMVALRSPGQLSDDLKTILAAYRQTIVLMWDEATLPAKDRPNAFIVGKLLFEENLPRLQSLETELIAEIEASVADRFKNPAALTEAFLSTLENEPSWRDADKLAFQDLVETIGIKLDTLAPDRPAGKALQVRINEDRKALFEIRVLYAKEMERVFAQFQTRGMPVQREAWDAYLNHLRSLYNAGSIMDTFREAISPKVAPPPPKPEKILSGYGLPPKILVLTFDDGPHPIHTQKILDILAQYQLQGIFYEIGQNLGKWDDKGQVKETPAAAWSRKVLAAGNLLGNHTYTHPCLPKLNDEQISKELDETSQMLKSVVGANPSLFRPPYGALSEPVRANAAARAMKTMIWSIDSLDWADPIPTSIANRVIGEAKTKGHGVILFHDIHGRTAEALPAIIETLQAEGFRFVLWDGSQIIDRGGPVLLLQAKSVSPAAVLYNDSWAVVIGINDYTIWPKLSYAVADALAMRDLLVNKFAFKPEKVTVLLDNDATRERILSALGDALGDISKVKKEDRVLVFYAGHGATRQLPSGRSLGYIIPVDAGTENYQGQAISMTHFQDIDEAIPAKHLFYIMDACYSGLALLRSGPAESAGDPRKYLAEITRRPARQMLTAGGSDQPVADNGPNGHSIFTWTVLQGLEGKADLNNDGFITASELFAYTGPAVSALSRQTPAFGNLAGSEGGDFVFELKHGDEFLSETSDQLDEEGLVLNAQLNEIHKAIAEKRMRNQALSQKLAAAKTELHKLDNKAAPETPPEQAQKALDKGLALYREKKYAEALAAFQEAYGFNPSNAQVANNIGFIYYKLEEFERALTWYERTLILDPSRAIAWANKGELFEKTERKADAAKAYKKFLEISPMHPSAAHVRSRLAALED